jgi:hypothetical protein
MYEARHVLTPEQRTEALEDFKKFTLDSEKQGLRGVRWNFDGCIICGAGKALYRCLIAHPTVTNATNGRSFGTHVCRKHVDSLRLNPFDLQVIDAVLLRNQTAVSV